MLADTVNARHRYPGAGPFQDDAVSHKTFFGREKETSDLASRVEVHRVTVVYGRSGLGKSSLLQAGLAPLLRESGYFPVFVRVNHTDTSLTTAIADYTQAEAKRQGIEHVRGQLASSWEYFKTVELWDGDRLLVPVIILDQFEEIFSTGSEEWQDAVIEEVGMMARGKPPGGDRSLLVELEEKYGSSSPKVQIVISIREDYLGHLEEIADEIPEIFDSRFRVTPLSLDAAKQALILPAAVETEKFNSPNFSIDEKLVSRALDYLTPGAVKGKKRRKRPGIEPFQLQLIGRRIEETAKRISVQSEIDAITVSFDNIGGDKGLARALEDFYATALADIDGWRNRRKIKALCLHHLISPDGKRQSLDEEAIERLVGLKAEILSELVESRLLRIDVRADTKYYELSHDTLVEPVLASQGFSSKSMRLFSLYLWFSWAVSIVIMIIGAVISGLGYFSDDSDTDLTTAITSLALVVLLAYAARFSFRRMQQNYKAHTRLNRLLKLNDRSDGVGSRLRSGVLLALLLCLGFPLLALGILLAIGVWVEFPGKEAFYLDRYITSIAIVSLTLYVGRYFLKSYRKLSGKYISTDHRKITRQTLSQKTAQRLRMLSTAALIVSIAIVSLPLTSYLDCTTASFQSFSDTLATMRLTNLSAWCEIEQDGDNNDIVWGLIFLSVVIFGLVRIKKYVVLRFTD